MRLGRIWRLRVLRHEFWGGGIKVAVILLNDGLGNWGYVVVEEEIISACGLSEGVY